METDKSLKLKMEQNKTEKKFAEIGRMLEEKLNLQQTELEKADSDPVECSSADIIEKVENSNLDEGVKMVVRATLTEVHSGPLPHPSILGGYESVLPGLANRIMTMAEEEQKHRHDIDKQCVAIDARDSRYGIIASVVIICFSLFIALLCAVLVPSLAGVILGAIFGVTGIGAVIVAIFNNTKTTWKRSTDNNKEKQAKDTR